MAKPKGFFDKNGLPHKNLQEAWGFNRRYLDIIVSSGELKKLILDRTEELGLSHWQVCQAAGLSYKYYKEFYLEQAEPLCSNKLRQMDMIRIANILGLEFKFIIVKTPIEKVDVQHVKDIKYDNWNAKRKSRENKDLDERYT